MEFGVDALCDGCHERGTKHVKGDLLKNCSNREMSESERQCKLGLMFGHFWWLESEERCVSVQKTIVRLQ